MMKRYNDTSDSNLHSDNKLDKNESAYPSRCLSISLGELEICENRYSKASQQVSNSTLTSLKNSRRTLEQMSPREQQAVVLLKSRLQSVPFYARKNLDAEGWLGLAWGMGPRNYGLID